MFWSVRSLRVTDAHSPFKSSKFRTTRRGRGTLLSFVLERGSKMKRKYTVVQWKCDQCHKSHENQEEVGEELPDGWCMMKTPYVNMLENHFCSVHCMKNFIVLHERGLMERSLS